MAGERGRRRPNDDEILLLAKSGDRAALGELVRRTRSQLEWTCREVFSSAAREDHLREAISEALTDIAAGFSSFRGENIRQYVGWQRVVARRAAIRVGERRNRLAREFPASADSDDDDGVADGFDPVDLRSWSVEDLVVSRERLADCLEALRQSKPRQWAALILFSEGHSMAEIGEVLETESRDVSIQDVKNWLFRARASQRDCLGGHDV